MEPGTTVAPSRKLLLTYYGSCERDNGCQHDSFFLSPASWQNLEPKIRYPSRTKIVQSFMRPNSNELVGEGYILCSVFAPESQLTIFLFSVWSNDFASACGKLPCNVIFVVEARIYNSRIRRQNLVQFLSPAWQWARFNPWGANATVPSGLLHHCIALTSGGTKMDCIALVWVVARAECFVM